MEVLILLEEYLSGNASFGVTFVVSRVLFHFYYLCRQLVLWPFYQEICNVDVEDHNIKIIARLHTIMYFVAKQSGKASWKNYGYIEILTKGGGYLRFLFCFLPFIYFFSNKKYFT